MADGVCHADQEPVPVTAPVEAATGVLVRVDGAAEDAQTDQLAELEGSTGLALAVVEQDVEVLVQTGTETVQGQSVTVRVVEPVTVYVLPAWTIVVADGM